MIGVHTDRRSPFLYGLGPQGDVALNRGSWQSENLDLLMPMCSQDIGRDISLSGNDGTNLNDALGLAANLDAGFAPFFGGTSEAVRWSSSDSAFLQTSTFTRCLWLQCTGSNSVDHALWDVGSRADIVFGNRGGGGLANGELGFTYYDGAFRDLTTGITSVSAGDVHHIAAVSEDGVGHWLYLDGVLVDSDANTSSIAYASRISAIGNISWLGAGFEFDGLIWDVRQYSVPLRADQIRELYDPLTRYEVYSDPIAAPLWIPAPGGGGAYSADLTAAAFAMTAQPLTHLAAYVGALSAPAFAMSAQALEVKESYAAELTAASFSMSPQAFDVQADDLIELGAASFAMTPQDVTVTGDTPIDLTAAAFAMTAQPITISDPAMIELGSASFAMTPYPVTIPGDPLSGNVTGPLTDGIGVLEELTDGEGVG